MLRNHLGKTIFLFLFFCTHGLMVSNSMFSSALIMLLSSVLCELQHKVQLHHMLCVLFYAIMYYSIAEQSPKCNKFSTSQKQLNYIFIKKTTESVFGCSYSAQICKQCGIPHSFCNTHTVSKHESPPSCQS